MAIYYIDENTGNRNTAGSKAPSDIAELCLQLGYQSFVMPSLHFLDNRKMLYAEEIVKLPEFWWNIYKRVSNKDILIYQHPTMGKPIAAKFIKGILENKHCKLVTVIHDLELLRGGIKGIIDVNTKQTNKFEKYILKHSSIIIAHNYKMKEYLVSIGMDENKIVELEIFDYLHGTNRKNYIFTEKPSISIAGTLSPQKCGYIYNISSLQNDEITINLYGKGFVEHGNDKLKYHGILKPEELGEKMIGEYGLVWDGPSSRTCEGNTGTYLMYNNPHKASLYLSSGIPVITWAKAAISKYVLDNNVGISVDSLDDLQSILMDISEERYREMVNNTREVSLKISSGYYFTKAIKVSVEKLS